MNNDSSDSKRKKSIDWNLCALCQERKTAPSVCPAKCNDKNVNGYEIMGNKLEIIHNANADFNAPMEFLCGIEGFEKTLSEHQAWWHKSCRLKVDKMISTISEPKEDNVKSTITTRGINFDKRTRSQDKSMKESDRCFFCGKDGEGSKDFHNAMTKEVTEKVRSALRICEEFQLLAKIADTDLIAIDAKYHHLCLVSLYNRTRDKETRQNVDHHKRLEALAYEQTKAHIEAYYESRENTDQAKIFPMSHLCNIYKGFLEQYGLPTYVHTSRLSEQLLKDLPYMTAVKQGKDKILIFKDDIGEAIKIACSDGDYNKEARNLIKAAKILRQEILLMKTNFDGRLESPDKTVPEILKSFFKMIIKGNENQQNVLTLAQLLCFNTKKRFSQNATHHRHTPEREPSFPLYISLKVHSETRKKGLIDMLHQNGIGVSYKRVMAVTTDIANSICKRYEEEGVAVPHNMEPSDALITGCLDNIDHNPSSKTSSDSFHGTSISLVQHLSCLPEGTETENTNGSEPLINESVKGKEKVLPLPTFYTDVRPVHLKDNSIIPDTPPVALESPKDSFLDNQAEWLDECAAQIKIDNVENEEQAVIIILCFMAEGK